MSYFDLDLTWSDFLYFCLSAILYQKQQRTKLPVAILFVYKMDRDVNEIDEFMEDLM
jgi:hypothetical protein